MKEEFKKGKEKGGKEEKKEKSDKTYVKIPQKQGRILEGEGEEFFGLARIYTPACRPAAWPRITMFANAKSLYGQGQ